MTWDRINRLLAEAAAPPVKKTGRRPAYLKNVVIDEISLVDRGANPHANIIMWKRHATDGSTEEGAPGDDIEELENLEDQEGDDTATLPLVAALMAAAKALAQSSVTKSGEPRLTVPQTLAKMLEEKPHLYDATEAERQAFIYAKGWERR